MNGGAYHTYDETHLPTAAHLLLTVQLFMPGNPAGFHPNARLIIIPTTYSPTSSIHPLTTGDGGKDQRLTVSQPRHLDVRGTSAGAILSCYQRVRVEHVSVTFDSPGPATHAVLDAGDFV